MAWRGIRGSGDIFIVDLMNTLVLELISQNEKEKGEEKKKERKKYK